MNIAFFEVDDAEAKILLDLYGDVDYETVKDKLASENADRYADAEIVSCFIYSDLSREVLEKLKKLKLVVTRSRTFDHIDIEYCNRNGITVANIPAYGGDTVAEYVFSLLLSLNRHTPQAVQRTREGDFSTRDLQGADLHGKTIGIIGTGDIGMRTAKIAKAFGMNVLGYDINPRLPIAEAVGLAYTALDRLLSQSDVISIHVANISGPGFLLSEREFSLMKEGVTIINTSIGAAIDLKALLRALSAGKVGAAGLDVLPDEAAIREDAEFLRESFAAKHDAETLLAAHALLRLRNVIVTPHIAFYTKETVEGILRVAGDNIRAFQSGQALNVVNSPLKGSYDQASVKTA